MKKENICIDIYNYFEFEDDFDVLQFENDMSDMFYWLLGHPVIAYSFFEQFKKVRDLYESNN